MILLLTPSIGVHYITRSAFSNVSITTVCSTLTVARTRPTFCHVPAFFQTRFIFHFKFRHTTHHNPVQSGRTVNMRTVKGGIFLIGDTIVLQALQQISSIVVG